MSTMSEKVAYLKGLAEGLGIDGSSDKGKLMLAIIDALDTFAEEASAIDEKLSDLSEYVEEIDSDVADLEEALFSEDDDEDDEDEEEDDDEDEDGDDLIEYECPNCGTVIFFNEEAFDMEEEHRCPNCNHKVFDVDDDASEDDEEEDSEPEDEE